MTGDALPHSFFARDAREVARDLLGKVLASGEGDAGLGGVGEETGEARETDGDGEFPTIQGLPNRSEIGVPEDGPRVHHQ